MKLDLHGKSHYEISNLIDKFIWDCIQKRCVEAEIITGNSERMKSFTIDVIKDYKLNYKVGNGYNNGYIKITLY